MKQSSVDFLREDAKGTEVQKQRCADLALKYRPSRKRLLIREATCKENPTLSKLKQYAHCRAKDCVRTFCYKKAFYNHMIVEHKYGDGKLILYY